MSVNSNSVNSNLVNQQAHYQQRFSQSRKLTLLNKQAPSISQSVNLSDLQSNKSLNQDLLMLVKNNIDEMLSKNTSVKETELEETYGRPLPPKIELMKVILEGYFNIEFEGYFSQRNLQANTQSDNNLQSLHQVAVEGSENNQINIDGIKFNSNDLLKVEQWQQHSQSLSYQMNGEFDVNGQHIKIDYSFVIASEQTSYSSVEKTAAALKDPLIVQFGEQSIGQIKGHQNFDINQDGDLNKLPVFSGDVGYLVYDKNQNLKADNGGELFGPKTGLGFNELAQLDSNKNGFIDSDDDAFEHLYLWQPEKSNNLRSLTEVKIQAINTSAIDSPFSFYDTKGNIMAQMRQSSFAISHDGEGKAVHQIDVII
jgi:hypothetical protein